MCIDNGLADEVRQQGDAGVSAEDKGFTQLNRQQYNFDEL